MFNTALMEPRLRTRAFRQWISSVADIHATDNKPMDVSIAAYDLGELIIARSSTSSARYCRDERVMERSEFNDRLLLRLSQGGEVRGNFGKDSCLQIKTGDIYLSDLSQPVDLLVDNGKHVNLLVPRRLLGESVRPLHGQILRKEHLPCRMLTQHLLRLVEMLPSLDNAHTPVVAQATIGVMKRCFQIAMREHGSHLWSERVRARMLAYIDAQIGDAELSAATLQGRFRISRTQLYRLFADLGGIQHHIRERRLEAAFRALRDHPEQTISEVIFQYGFTNERQFQRAFRSHYGMTATEARDR
ncbi:helix-turn-helix domain-containing protein [Rhodanobacter sp. Col0626]|uniref:helix-turn-helix domain-containing protein n=1 Tax=Rhodanobacter sp. Col0626 TaxID=3415679 RepID=UPI003CEC90EF